MITPGLSSTKTSTPVARSKALMLRPSRPIILPLISSEGMATVEVMVSGATELPKRWMAATRMSLAFCSSFSLPCCSNFWMRIAMSSSPSLATLEINSSLAASEESPATLSSSLPAFSFASSVLSLIALTSAMRIFRSSTSFSASFCLPSIDSSFFTSRSSSLRNSPSRNLISDLEVSSSCVTFFLASETIFSLSSLAESSICFKRNSREPRLPRPIKKRM